MWDLLLPSRRAPIEVYVKYLESPEGKPIIEVTEEKLKERA